MSTRLPPWSRRDNFSAPAHQRVVDAVNAMANLTATGQLSVESTPGGQTILDLRNDGIVEIGFGRVADTGPVGDEDDFTAPDTRYWVYRQRVTADAGDADGTLAELVDDEAQGRELTMGDSGDEDALVSDEVVVATDPFNDSRRWKPGQKCLLVTALARDASGGFERAYVMLAVPRPETATVRVTAPRDGAGMYDGVLCADPAVDVDPDADLAIADTAIAIVIENTLEEGSIYVPFLSSDSPPMIARYVRTNAPGTDDEIDVYQVSVPRTENFEDVMVKGGECVDGMFVPTVYTVSSRVEPTLRSA